MLSIARINASGISCVRSSSWNKLFCRGLSSTSHTSNDNNEDEIILPTNTTLALSVHFRHPDLGMKDYEILSRASAFLLNVDPPNAEEIISNQSSAASSSSSSSSSSSTHNSQGHVQKSAYPHLRENRDLRKQLLRKQHYSFDPAGGAPRLPHQLNWLEFCPTNFRPKVHVVASSHVISPWLWPKYYGQDWLQIVTQEHVRYSLEVWGSNEGLNSNNDHDNDVHVAHDGKLKGGYKPIAKFALNPYPIHHPNEMDVAVIHLKQEEEALKQMMKLGVQPLNLPTSHDFENDDSPVFEAGERVLCQGFEVYEANMTDQETVSNTDKNAKDGDDERIFHPYSALGSLTFASPDRFLCETKGGPLPEGLCGGPVIELPEAQSPLKLRGVVEGIVPVNHENSKLAGQASFIPAYRIREFVDYSERFMLEQIIDSELFKRVVEMKEQKTDSRGTVYGTDGQIMGGDDDEEPIDPKLMTGIEGTGQEFNTPRLDREFQEILTSLRENHSPEEVDAILATVEREGREVAEILEKEGGDVDDVIARVRRRTYEKKDKLMEEIADVMTGQNNKS